MLCNLAAPRMVLASPLVFAVRFRALASRSFWMTVRRLPAAFSNPRSLAPFAPFNLKVVSLLTCLIIAAVRLGSEVSTQDFGLILQPARTNP